ncbi:MAG: hypothetical protein GY937_05785 [bacterium]|nr:hypothetical protein [bacterium]
MRRVSVLLAALFLAFGPALAVRALVLSPVIPDRRVFEPSEGESVRVRFRIDEPAQLTLRIWDGRDLQVRAVDSEGELPAGEHALAWDGKDSKGRLVPADAYHYTLVATGAGGATVLHDLTDSTGGEAVSIEAIRWDADSGRVHYVVASDCRISLRAGLAEDGPLLRTILDWPARMGGHNDEPWDGQDASSVFDLTHHPKLELSANAVSLPANTLFVGAVQATTEPRWIAFDESPPKRDRAKGVRGPRSVFDQPAEGRHDLQVVLSVHDQEGKRRGDAAVATGFTHIQLDVPDPAERERLLAERFEVVFFVDGIFRFENEVGFLPTSWRWKTETVSPGVHYVTGNLRGYSGNFGTATLAVEIDATTKPKTEAE